MENRWISYVNLEGGSVYYNLQTGETVPILSKNEGERTNFCGYFPDGKNALVSRVDYHLRDNLARRLRPRYFKVNMDTGEEEELFTAWDRSEVQICNLFRLGNGKYFASAAKTEDRSTKIYIVNEKGDEMREVWGAPAYPYGFALSPDGMKIAYHVAGPDPFYNPEGEYAVNIMDADGGNQKMLHCEKGHLCFGPEWSPDGQWLTFVDCEPLNGDPGHGKANVCVIRPDGTDFKRLTSNREQYFATTFGLQDYRGGGSNDVFFSPGGKIIHSRMSDGASPDAYFDSEKRDHEEWTYDPSMGRGSCALCYLDPADGSCTPVTKHIEGRWDFRPTFSRDGNLLLFTSYRFGHPSEIRLLDLRTGDERVITRGLNDHGADFPSFVYSDDDMIRRLAVLNK